MPCGDPAVGWARQLEWQARARAAPGGSPGMPNPNLYLAGWWFVGGLATVNSPLYPVRILYSLVKGSFGFAFILVYLAIYYLASFWADQVTKIVPDPYLVCQPSFITTSPLTLYRTKCFIFLKRKPIALVDLISGTQSSQRLLDCELLPISNQNPILMFSATFSRL
jgi:hypothetical protein